MTDRTQQSSSNVQQAAEILIRDRLSETLQVDLAPKRLRFGAAAVDVDGVTTDESVLVEIFAHQGPLKGGQRHKIQDDALKLATLARSRPASRLILAFGDKQAAEGVVGWLAEALEAWEIETLVVNLPENVRAELRAAQLRQTMVNPAVDSGAGR